MASAAPPTRAAVMTPPTPGAIAIIQVQGPAAIDVVTAQTGRVTWKIGRMYRARFADIDEGLAVRLADDLVQLMPHGGTRVVQNLLESLRQAGVALEEQAPATELYPEANSPIEADMLAAIARAASPLAIDLLARQPDLWRSAVGQDRFDPMAIIRRTAVLDRLIVPPTVVVVGPANVGKSTLSNRLLGRAASVVADLPGTTRDWVAGLAELNVGGGDRDPQQAVAVRWLDTPGLRVSEDVIEQRALDLARRVIAEAELIIAMRDPEHDWPETDSLPRAPDLWVINKCDVASRATPGDATSPAAPLPISAKTGENLGQLERAVIDALGLAHVDDAPALWAFCDTLKQAVGDRGEIPALAAYLAIAGSVLTYRPSDDS